MPNFKDRTGELFGSLLVLKCVQKASRKPKRKTVWLCRCSCGKEVEISASNLVTGNSTCCIGCRAINSVTHGHAKRGKTTKEYESWNHMLSRCNNPKHKHYQNYGGRGVTVCDDWLLFTNFINDMGECPKDFTIERIDNEKGYCKENCKWASRSEQSYNRRKDVKNTSGVEGVSLRTDTNKWTAYINYQGIRLMLGCYENKEDAILARRNKELELYGKIKDN